MAFALLLAVIRYILAKKLPVALPLGLSVMFIGSLWQNAILAGNPQALRMVRGAVLSLFVAMPIIAELAYAIDYGYHEQPLQYIASYTIGVACFLLCTTKLRLQPKWLVHMGTISYSIYLMHTRVMLAVEAIGLVPHESAQPWVQWTWVAAMMALVVLVSHVTYLCIERPFVSVGRRLMTWRHASVGEPLATG